jgi:CheY-like chemotaxis protein
MSPPAGLDILLVEDDEVDVLAFRRASEGLGWRIRVAAGAEEALAALRSRRGRPPLVVLDLNLPGIDGHGFLARLRAESGGAAVPVVVLTTSRDPRDVAAAWGAHVAGYFAKPLDRVEYRAMVVAIGHYWSRSESPP